MDIQKISAAAACLILSLIVSFRVFASETAELLPPQQLVISDFNINNGNPPNNVGGAWGEWNSTSVPCSFSLDASDALRNPSGHSMKLYYDVSSPYPYIACAFWERLGPEPIHFNLLDGSAYKSLSFYVRGDRSGDFSPKVKIELKDISLNPRAVIVENITTQWKKVTIPFLQFEKTPLPAVPVLSDELDQSQLAEFTVRFDKNTAGSQVQGNIFIDHVALSTEIAPLIIASFDPELVIPGIDNVSGLINPWGEYCGFENTAGYVGITYHTGNSCGLWAQFGRSSVEDNTLDATDYKTIQFDVKGDVTIGTPGRLKVDLKSFSIYNVPLQESGYIADVTSDWKTYKIPVAAFGNRVDKTRLREIAIGADSHLLPPANQWQGKFYVDNIIFSPLVSDLLVADFNLGDNSPSFPRLTNSYGLYGSFDGGGTCLVSPAPDSGANPVNHSVKIDFADMEASNPYCGLWVNLSSDNGFTPDGIDARDYRYLKFKVKGDNQAGFPSRVRVDLYSIFGATPGHLFVHVPVTSEWKEVAVPLDQLISSGELAALDQIVVTVDSNDPVNGAIYIDDVKLSRRPVLKAAELADASLELINE